MGELAGRITRYLANESHISTQKATYGFDDIN